MATRIIDSTIMCNLLRIPNRCQHAEEVEAAFQSLIIAGVRFVLPAACIIESGNAISRLPNGNVRRKLAQTLVEFVNKAINGDMPFTVSGDLDVDLLRDAAQQFSDKAMIGIELADLLIAHEYHTLRRRRIPDLAVWSFDDDFDSLDVDRVAL